MSMPFSPQADLIIVGVVVEGPSGSAVLRLALDTGTTGTLINVGMLVALGYDPALAPEHIQVTTGSGVEFMPRISLEKNRGLGVRAPVFPCARAHSSPSAGIDGLLGLDFVRGQTLTVDFRTGTLTLT